jgi:hypothetical protein
VSECHGDVDREPPWPVASTGVSDAVSGPIRNVYTRESEQPVASVALTVTEKLPELLGVPESVEPSRCKPAGGAPLTANS